MSDDEYEYDYGSDADYDYGSDQGEEQQDDGNDELIEIENSYYEGDDVKSDDPQQAIRLFEKVVELETKHGDQVKWRFKALQRLVVIYFGQKMYDKMVERYRAMLQYLGSVTRNECTEAINAILDAIAAVTNVQVLSEMYEITLIALKTANNERLWFNTNLKLAKLYLESRKIPELERLITDLKATCQNPDGTDDISKGNYLLEVYCLEIQLCSMTLNAERMRRIYPRTLNLNAAVSDPRIMGIIREEGGKMQMAEGNWEEAYNELNKAFRSYQECGNTRARDCLKYLALASMLSLSDINPFAAPEAKVFSDDVEVVAMSDLRQSLEANDLARFERTVNNKKNRILDEPFIMKYLEPLRRRMREQVLINMLRPYQKVTLKYIGQELNLSFTEVELLLIDLISSKKLKALLDQPEGLLILDSTHNASSQEPLLKWMNSLEGLGKDLLDQYC